MSKFITTKIRPKLSTAACRQVQIKAFNTSTPKWKKLSLDWLRQMASQTFECTQGHTLNISGGCQIQFVIFVCERVTSLTTSLPPRIYFDHFEITTQVGHAIMADCDSFPVSVKVLQNFWREAEDSPHFESLVMPLVDDIIASFGEGE